jgi:hypothetical protein
VSDQTNTATGYFDIPSGTTAQRPASPNTGMIRYNTSTLALETYVTTGWVNVTDPATFLNTNLLLYYDFGNASSYSGSGTVVYDLSGNSNTGNIQGSPVYSGSNGGIFNFTAAGQYIATSFKMPVAPRSHGYWVKFNSVTGTSGGVAISGTQEGGAYTYLGIKEGGEIYYYIGSSTGEYTPGFGVIAGTWFHLFQTITANGTVNIYKNGVAGFTATGVNVGNAATANFGVGALGGGGYSFGAPTASLGKVTVYNIALTTQQVLDNFNADKSRYGY